VKLLAAAPAAAMGLPYCIGSITQRNNLPKCSHWQQQQPLQPANPNALAAFPRSNNGASVKPLVAAPAAAMGPPYCIGSITQRNNLPEHGHRQQ
jgi:hypothetical protein